MPEEALTLVARQRLAVGVERHQVGGADQRRRERARAPWTSILAKGYWPQVEPAFWSIALLRWDINVRESAVLGLVGAGGIGMALNTALEYLQWPRVATVLIAILVVVLVAEIVDLEIR